MVSQDRPGAPSKAPAYSFGTRTPTSIKDTVKGGVLLHDGWAVDRQPGPGQYQVERKVGADMPAFSLGSRFSTHDPRPKSPGPAYDPNYCNTSPRKRDPAYSFGVRPSSGRSPAPAPGPGAYDSSPRRGGPAFSLGARIEKSSTNAGSSTRGPTAVRDPHFGPPPGYSFGGSSRPAGDGGPRNGDAPGPGQYASSPRPVFPTAPAYSLGGRPTHSPRGQAMPGPGQYDVAAKRPGTVGPHFGSGGRSKLEGNDAPGPGQYSASKKWDGPAVTLKGRVNDPRTTGDRSPGPAYDPDFRVQSPRKRDPAFSFGSSSRPADSTRPVSPGPGAYEPAREKSSPAFTLGARIDHDAYAKDATPAAGAIHDPHFGPGKGYSFGVKNAKDGMPVDRVPGPGQYDVKPKKQGPAFSLGGKQAGGGGTRSTVPGPGQYNVTRRPKSAGPGFGTSRRPKAGGNDAPGPGQYSANKKWDGPAATIKGRLADQRDSGRSPGPAYDPDFRVQSPRKRDPAFSFGSSSRPADGTRPVSPGPGAYDPAKKGGGSPAFSLGQRIDRGAKDATPGAGAIRDPQFGPGKGYSFGVKTDLEATVKNDVVLLGGGREQKPGPGAYDASPKRSGPAFSIYGREHGQRGEMKPGPGQYDVGFSWPAKGWGCMGATP